MTKTFEFITDLKRLFAMGLIGVALGMTGINALLSHVQDTSAHEAMTLSADQEAKVLADLIELTGEELADVQIVKWASGRLTADIDTVFGLQRIVFDIEGETMSIVDAYRL